MPHNVLGVVTSATQFYRSIGGSVGLAILGSYMISSFGANLDSNLSPGVKAALPPGQLAEIADNPQALMDPGAFDQIEGMFAQQGEQGPALAAQLVEGLRVTLATAISDVFTIGLIAIVIAFVITLFLKEAPLRGRVKPAEPSEAAAL